MKKLVLVAFLCLSADMGEASGLSSAMIREGGKTVSRGISTALPEYLIHQQHTRADAISPLVPSIAKLYRYDRVAFNEKYPNTVTKGTKWITYEYELYTQPILSKVMYVQESVFDETTIQLPRVPHITQVNSCQDILHIAHYLKDYHNYMTKYYWLNQEPMYYWGYRHWEDIQSQINYLLDLVRPEGDFTFVNERINQRIQAVIENKQWNLGVCYFNQLMPSDVAGYESFNPVQDIPVVYDTGYGSYVLIMAYNFRYDFSWGKWIHEHKDLSEAALRCLQMVWKDPIPSTLSAFTSQAEFEAALMETDPLLREIEGDEVSKASKKAWTFMGFFKK